jgi:hypothetical protein
MSVWSGKIIAVVRRPTIPDALTERPFLYAEARRLGVSRAVLRGPRFRRVFQGVNVDADVPDTVATRMRAARLVLPEAAVFSHQTAAAVQNLPVPGPHPIHATVPRAIPRARVAGIVTHQSALIPTHTYSGFAVTTPERTFCDLSDQLTLVDLTI